MNTVPEQRELCRELPVVIGNVDYKVFQDRLERIDELLRVSGMEREFVVQGIKDYEEKARAAAQCERREYKGLSVRCQARIQRMYRQALRCNVARQLTEKEYRRFSRRLADSPLLQWFCEIERVDAIRVPSKSTLDRYDKLAPEKDVRTLVDALNRKAGEAEGSREQPLGLEETVGLEVMLADTTCVKANIHFPVDWVLLRDGVRTLLKAIQVIRRHGIKHRMEEPGEFLHEMNRLSMEMAQSRRRTGVVKGRKRILRRMKRLSRLIQRHAERYREALERRWRETDLSEGEMRQIVRRMEGVLEQLPAAIRQAHERIIGGRLVKNEEKLLSLYERELHVIVRGKANAEVEFGNTLFLAEQADGVIMDWRLVRETSPGDPALLTASLERLHKEFGCDPLGVGADRGFDNRDVRGYLEQREIYNGVAARSIKRLKAQCQDEGFETLQGRRSQTEGRIGILQNEFLGRPMRSKGFEHRELNVAWAVLAHNLWVIARLPQAAAKRKKKAA
ncbi:MAG: hypothetical protein L6455_11615 [Kiritimatiellae bacterium]|nr:hypothetical protein [Kiritimatiellia bacterium]